MCGIDWAMCLEYLKVLLSWPVMALGLTVFVVTRFHAAIDSLIRRVTKGSIPGVEFEVAAVQLVTVPEADQLANALQTIGVDPPAEEFPAEMRDDPRNQRAAEFARRFPVQTVIEYHRILAANNFERLFNRIFGTQVALLLHLSNQTEPVPVEQLQSFSDENQQRTGKSDYKLADFVGFLAHFTVVRILDADKTRRVEITRHGREFLSYIQAQYPADWNKRTY